MKRKVADRKQVAQFVPAASKTHGAHPGELLGVKFGETQSLLDAISSGLRWASVSRFLRESGFTRVEIADYLGVTSRTIARRKERDSLDEHESERMLRLAEVYAAALELLDGDKVDAHEWLLSPVRGLNNRRPIDYARTDFGAREVRSLIGRLEHGVFS
jgi:putative toxin-antitoxin system antitoxin component (TIGR02293 family)